MKNINVVKNFIHRVPAYGSHLISTGDKLISYHTTIAQFSGNELHINKTKYSRTTLRHLNYIYIFIFKNTDFSPYIPEKILIEKDNLGRGISNIVNIDSKFIVDKQKYCIRYGI